MRLIDADEVVSVFDYYITHGQVMSRQFNSLFYRGMQDAYARARSVVLEMPTIDTSNDHVKHGRWIYYDGETIEDGGRCSICQCDQPVFLEDWTWKYVETDYCPNCGAYMKGEQDEAD